VQAEVGGGDQSKILFGARMAANAARAIDLGLGEREALEPPPFYAYDPDIGRLAVSTPSYSTAVLAANHGAVAPATCASSAATASPPTTSRRRGR
jgi:hypothetical protein